MTSVSHIINHRRRERSRVSQSPWRRLGMLSALLASLFLLSIAAVGIWLYIELMKDLPSFETLDTDPTILTPISNIFLNPTRFYDRSHEQVILTLQNPVAKGRQYLQLGSRGQSGQDLISPYLVDATISELDPGFWDEPGYTWSGIGEGVHPTLAQRLVSDLLLDAETASIKRDIRERLLAGQITAKFGREKVLEWYLNSAKYGNFIYGADAAARVYFGISATRLNLAQAAMLTAMVENPSTNPWSASQQMRDKEVEIIQGMLKNGLISDDQARQALMENIQFQPQEEVPSLAPALTDLVLLQLGREYPLERVYRGGYEVVTTLDYGLQSQAQCAVQVQLNQLEGAPIEPPADPELACDASEFLPSLQLEEQSQPEDLHANVIILDPSTGEILAWVGGDQVNPAPALPVGHPAGTILSPLLYLTAFSQGMSPASLLWDLPESTSQEVTKDALAAYHGPVRLRMAMVNDYAGAFAEVAKQVGIENVWKTQQKFGVNTQDINSSASSGLDELYSQPISLLEGVQAYGVLANNGLMAGQLVGDDGSANGLGRISASGLLRVKSVDGRVALDWSQTHIQPIVTEQLAYLTTDVLSDEQARQAGSADAGLLTAGRPAGVKNSLTAGRQDAWVIGYTPQLVVGVWVGTSQGGVNPDVATGLWHAMMEYASAQLPVQDFPVPEGISRVQVCDPSGMLPTPACPSVVTETFLQGSEPTQADDLYQELPIDQQTGLLATVFTPSEQVERRIFIKLPPEAREWARAVNLPIAPDTYDTIDIVPVSSGQVQITSPAMNGYISGQVEITGSALGNDFSYYRLQVGQGLYPQQWVQLGQDVQAPVEAGALGSWDTAGLEGEYLLELLVVHTDLHFERFYLPVTVDNAAPVVRILAPKANGQPAYQADESLILHAEVSDNISLARVEFSIDGEALTTLYEAPFVAVWQAQAGAHTLQVKATDSAGNHNAATVSFSVSK